MATMLAPIAAPAMASTSLSSGEQQVLDLLNDRRARAGVPALPVHDDLMADARRWASEMARRGTISHSSPTPGDWRAYSENVGMGSDLGIVQQEFEKSDTHDHTMVDAQWSHVGVAEARGADGNVYVVQKYATYPAPAPVPPPPPPAAAEIAPPSAPTPAPPPTAPPEPVVEAETAAPPTPVVLPQRDVRAAAGVIVRLRGLRTLDDLAAPPLPLRAG